LVKEKEFAETDDVASHCIQLGLHHIHCITFTASHSLAKAHAFLVTHEHPSRSHF
jgi:hypothetical protein